MVEDVIFAPSQHGSGVGIAIDGKGRAGPTFTSISVPEKYAIVFRCEHGRFVVQGESERCQHLWQHLKGGETVQVTYREIYLVGANTRELIGFDFIDAR